MKSLTMVWRDIPKRHKLILGTLLVLLILLIFIGFLAARGKQSTGQVSLALPSLPQIQTAQPNMATSQQPTTYEGNDLRIAARRPVLTSPGLEFITSTPPVAPRSTSTTAPSQPTPSAHTTQESVASKEVASIGQPGPAHQSSDAAPPKVATQSVPPQSEVRGRNDSVKFASLPADAWLLQIAAVSNEQDAKSRCHSLSLPCTTYATMRQGRQVWVLVAGPYANRAGALAAVARLPVSMQHGPFPRPVKDVRQDAGE